MKVETAVGDAARAGCREAGDGCSRLAVESCVGGGFVAVLAGAAVTGTGCGRAGAQAVSKRASKKGNEKSRRNGTSLFHGTHECTLIF